MPRLKPLRWLLAPFDAVLRHRRLTWQLTQREILGRYKGATFGLLWSILSPFFLLCVYTFAFGTLLGGRWPQPEAKTSNFALVLFAGLIIHGFLAECLLRAPTLIVANPNYVKRVVFPLDILPWTLVFSSLFHVAMNVLVFIVLRLFLDKAFSPTVLLLPVVLAPMTLLVLGLGWFLSSTGVYLRDIAQVTGLLSVAMLFLSSAMIPVSTVPLRYQWLFNLNPLTPIIDQARNVMLWDRLPDFGVLAAYALCAAVFMYFGKAWFEATKRGFADVI